MIEPDAVQAPYLTADTDVDRPPTAVEERFLKEALRRVRSLESRARGLFAEVLIAELLPESELGPHVMSRWDLRRDGITIAVRTTGTVNSYSQAEKPASGWAFLEHGSYDDAARVLSQERQRCWTDVVVLAHHQGAVLSDGWTFTSSPLGSSVSCPAGSHRPERSVSRPPSGGRGLEPPYGRPGWRAVWLGVAQSMAEASRAG